MNHSKVGPKPQSLKPKNMKGVKVINILAKLEWEAKKNAIHEHILAFNTIQWLTTLHFRFPGS